MGKPVLWYTPRKPRSIPTGESTARGCWLSKLCDLDILFDALSLIQASHDWLLPAVVGVYPAGIIIHLFSPCSLTFTLQVLVHGRPPSIDNVACLVKRMAVENS